MTSSAVTTKTQPHRSSFSDTPLIRPRKPHDPQSGHLITHPNGQTSFYYLDDFTPAWLPESSKQVVLLQHGCVHTADFWAPWVPHLASKYIVIRRDARGHGRSSYPTRLSPWSKHATEEDNVYQDGYKYTAETIVDEIIDFLDQLNVTKVHFVGEATSGEVGEIFAARYPGRIHTLTTVSSPTYLPPAAIKMFSVGKASWPEAVMELGARGWGQALTQNPGTIGDVRGRDEYRNWWLDAVGITHREGLAGYVIFLTHLSSREYLEGIKCPMLILAPTNSSAVPMSESEWVQGRVQGAKLVKIQGTGHEVFIENANDCVNAFLSFLNELGKEKQ